MKKLILTMCLACNFLSSVAFAETTQQEARRVCEIYAQNPESFRRLEKQECECNLDQKASCECVKPNNPRYPEQFAYFPSGGSCYSSDLGIVTGSDNKVSFLGAVNAEEGSGFGTRVSLLGYQDKLYAEINGFVRQLARVDKDGLTILCGIHHDIKYDVKKDESGLAPVCEKFSKGDFTKLENQETKLPVSEGLNMPRETSLQKHISQDLDGDGILDSIVLFERQSGAGCGCAMSYLDTMENLKSAFNNDGSSTDNPIFEETTCGTLVDISTVSINKKLYLMEEVSTHEFDHVQNNKRRLLEFSKGNLNAICEQTPTMTKTIDFKGDKSGFTAVE